MNIGDGLASGAKSASFTASDKRMTKEQWAAMFEPEEPVSSNDVEKRAYESETPEAT